MEKLPQDIEYINQQLVSRFGRSETDRPRYKLVWSEHELEYRKVFHYNKVQLIFPEVMLTRKYSYIKDRYILEKLIIGVENVELDGSPNTGSYEPIWVFEDAQFNRLRPVWRVVQVLALASEGGVGEKTSLSDYMSEDEEKKKLEIEYFEDMLNDGTDYGNQSVSFVKPVYISDTKMKENNNE